MDLRIWKQLKYFPNGRIEGSLDGKNWICIQVADPTNKEAKASKDED